MKRTYLLMLIALFSIMLISHASAQIFFYADFEVSGSKAVPDVSVNDPANWVPENAGTVWVESDEFPDGSGALHQSAEGCGISGDTPLPGVADFSDGIIQAVFSWQDDDSVGFMLRRVGDDSGYLVSFGYNETSQVIIGSLADGCCPSGQCLDQCGCENGGKEIASEPHGLGGGLDQTNAVAYLGRVEVKGSNVKIWYMKLDEVDDLFAPSEDLGAPILESDKATNKSAGSVGVWHESWGMGRIDSILVTNANGFDVDAKGKLTTSWGAVKTSY